PPCQQDGEPHGKWMICPACDGDGRCVNPNIDAHGITGDEMREDPDFARDYQAGVYDIECAACSGSGKLRESQLANLRAAAEERRTIAAECGDFGSGVSDYRFGY
ncbi:MAG: hypothetical protein OXC11_14385, partial [Rhodospirillales bacterium]|nr:hypothetical protein [Rhodospirillales bacterium]